MSTSPLPDADETVHDPHRYLMHLLWDVATRTELIGEAELAGTSLTLASSGMIQIIGATPGTTIADMARGVPKSQQAISQIVARLEKLGFVERRLGRGRGVGLHLTEAGEVACAEAAACEARMDERLAELFGTDAYEQLRGLLERARDALTD